MSQVRDANFVVLTGHLNDYPLADLISILRRQRKTGRLLVEYAISPCALYFKEGDLVDAQLSTFSGLQAVFVALSQPNSAFNFNPLIEASRRTINHSSQKVILELLGCWEEKPVEVEPTSAEVERAISTIQAQGVVQTSVEAIDAELEPVEHESDVQQLPSAKEVLALPPAPVKQTGGRVVIISAVVSLIVSFLTVLALASWLTRGSVPPAQTSASASVTGSQTSDAVNSTTVKVVLQVEGGRVQRASVAEHRPGLEAYETEAIRIARGRRYPANAVGQDIVLVTINTPR